MNSHWDEVAARYPEKLFAAFRLLFGLYLCQHFLLLLPHSTEVFSRIGMLPSVDLNPTSVIFPNLLAWVDTPGGVHGWLLVMALLSLAFAAGAARRVSALVLWYGFACLFNRNVLISNPSLGFIGWLLLAMALLPGGEPWTIRFSHAKTADPGSRVPWRMSPVLYWGAWFLLAVGYTASGLHKLTAPSWRDGTALGHVLSIPLARDVPLREWLLGLDPGVLKWMTWGALSAEIAYLPLALWKHTRAVAWLSMVVMHCGILSVIAFAELSLGMLLVHLFVFDVAWLKRLGAAIKPGSEDAECCT